ncbi:MAG: bifunctional folylpolyglutamate synthase/dihydrofolate synthase [Treponema sp.]|nr:bifunctional folylpolyglutamate synthase/dihydrofolate synthase [Treponema sp.]
MAVNFTSSAEVFKWLSNFINLEKGQKPKSFRIDRMEALSFLSGNPHKCAPSVHIAGSKGKGSVTSMIASILTASGYRAARYMSPHVADIRERICLDGTFFSEDIYRLAGDELRDITETRLRASNLPPAAAALFDANTPDGCEPTYWELLTLYFFLCARYAKCDILVVETGLGGRLDSTNILDPLVSVITLIELEHTNFLGGTIAQIAGEKAGIIKRGRPLVLAGQRADALEVFRKKARETESPLYYLPETAEITNIDITARGTDFRLAFSEIFGQPKILNLSIPIPGKVQAENAALAVTALEVISKELSRSSVKAVVREPRVSINDEAVRRGLINLRIPGRFERISDDPPFIIDGAHTPESLAHCVETFRLLYGESGVLIFGCAADKDARAMARTAHQFFTMIIITTPGTFKTSVPEQVFEAFSEAAGEGKVLLVKDTRDAVKQALNTAQGNRHPLLGTGSFYLVSEIRKLMEDRVNL